MIQTIIDTAISYWQLVPPMLQNIIWIVCKIVAIMLPLIVTVAYFTYAERKVIGYMQHRIGPNRVGWKGLLQPWADTVKLMFKEVVVPSSASRFLYFTAPILVLGPSLAAWSVIPFNESMVLADLDVGLLFVLAVSSLGVYGIILAGWASNSKYAFLGAMRSAAQMVAYEIAMGFALVGVLMASNSLNLSAIIAGQEGSILHWYWLPLLPLFLVYVVSGVAETNRAPFDVAEGESEIVAGFHVEYSGITFSMFFLAEYANIILICALTSIMFLGGWLSPLQGIVPDSAFELKYIGWLLGHGSHWFFAKMAFFMLLYLWFRATFPRYRYDQIMRLGWKVLLPVTIAWLVVEGVFAYIDLAPWFAEGVQ